VNFNVVYVPCWAALIAIPNVSSSCSLYPQILLKRSEITPHSPH
jgi:hypothetical protein